MVKPIKLLVVDDDLLVRHWIYFALFDTKKYKITFAVNGFLAVEQMSLQDFDLIFMDVNMPQMDGIEATKQIRLINAEVPIIGMTANTDKTIINKCLNAGMNQVLQKPIERKQLFQILNQNKESSNEKRFF
jgi:CheY-like chemotaxis protein